MTLKAFINADWASPIENTVRQAAKVVAVVYVAGYCFGKAVHGLNDRLAAFF